MKKTLTILAAVLNVIACQDVFSQHLDFDSLYTHDSEFKRKIHARPSFDHLFYDGPPVRIAIESDFKNLIKRKYKGEYQPATFRYFVNDTVVVTRDIQVKPRGNMRRRTCYFPPLMLNFRKKEVVLKEIHDFDKLKMVVECKRGSMYEQYLLSEYYAYKIYNLITDYSFRVRLFEITLKDINGKMKDVTGYSYLIENIDQLAMRNSAVQIETQHVRDKLTDLSTLANGYLFQYLIGNTDWSIPAMHNIKLVKSTDPAKKQPYFIPYDFDYAGIVNTNYAVPDERLGIESVTERVYRGVCIDEKYLFSAAQRFIEQKDKIYDLYNSSTLIEKNNRKSTIAYLDSFYLHIEDDKMFRKYILENCRE